MLFYTNKTRFFFREIFLMENKSSNKNIRFFSLDFLSLYHIILLAFFKKNFTLKSISAKSEKESINYNDQKQIKF